MTIRGLIADALMELGVVGAIDDMDAHDAALCLRILNRILNLWNTEQGAIYADQLVSGTATATATQSIGPSSLNFTRTERPTTIRGAASVRGDTRTPLAIGTFADYQRLTDPALTSTEPSTLFYNPTWPDGTIYLYPVPSGTMTLELLIPTILASVALTDTFTMPQGYEMALTLTLAEFAAPAFKVQVSPLTIQHAAKARAAIWAANDTTPPLTVDVGLGGGPRGFDYRTGGFL